MLHTFITSQRDGKIRSQSSMGELPIWNSDCIEHLFTANVGWPFGTYKDVIIQSLVSSSAPRYVVTEIMFYAYAALFLAVFYFYCTRISRRQKLGDLPGPEPKSFLLGELHHYISELHHLLLWLRNRKPS